MLEKCRKKKKQNHKRGFFSHKRQNIPHSYSLHLRNLLETFAKHGTLSFIILLFVVLRFHLPHQGCHFYLFDIYLLLFTGLKTLFFDIRNINST